MTAPKWVKPTDDPALTYPTDSLPSFLQDLINFHNKFRNNPLYRSQYFNQDGSMIIIPHTKKVRELSVEQIKFLYSKYFDLLPLRWNAEYCQSDWLTQEWMVDFEFKRYMIENDFNLSPDHPYVKGETAATASQVRKSSSSSDSVAPSHSHTLASTNNASASTNELLSAYPTDNAPDVSPGRNDSFESPAVANADISPAASDENLTDPEMDEEYQSPQPSVEEEPANKERLSGNGLSAASSDSKSPTHAPTSPIPTPRSPTPTPSSPIPTPRSPTPTPTSPIPTPTSPIPTAVSKSPTPTPPRSPTPPTTTKSPIPPAPNSESNPPQYHAPFSMIQSAAPPPPALEFQVQQALSLLSKLSSDVAALKLSQTLAFEDIQFQHNIQTISLLHQEDIAVARSAELATSMINKLQATLGLQNNRVDWAQKESWEAQYLRQLKVAEMEKLAAMKEEKLQKALNVKLLHEVNELRKRLNMEPYPNVPERSRDMEAKDDGSSAEPEIVEID